MEEQKQRPWWYQWIMYFSVLIVLRLVLKILGWDT